jgi:anti-sigma regulatory factor (Ser/Thr protein kinase)
MATVELEIPSRSAYVGVVRLALASLARSAEFGEELIADLKTAVSEACANAVLSQKEAGVESPISIAWTVEDARAIVEVGDRGGEYQLDAEGSAHDSVGISSRLTMSAALLRSLVDECRLLPREGGGMCARLAINRQR